MLRPVMNRILQCERCRLNLTRRKVVLGRGELPCDILLIGEAPGKTEELLGESFTGQAGVLLDRMLKESKLDTLRLYFTNTVLCRPANSRMDKNREPNGEEVLNCAPNVQYIIGLAKPKRVILLGETAKRYFKKEFPDALGLYHPSYILQSGSEASPYYLPTIRTMEELYTEMMGG